LLAARPSAWIRSAICQRFKDVESETARNLSAFESNGKKQVESLVSQLREEKDIRADADKEIERTLREHRSATSE
jgi:hypothetical protein